MSNNTKQQVKTGPEAANGGAANPAATTPAKAVVDVGTKSLPTRTSGLKWVYLFDELNDVEAALKGTWDDVRALLGGKGANLAEMTRLGVTVPPGLTITTRACNQYLAEGCVFPADMWEQTLRAVAQVEAKVGKKFGASENPLLFSVRSGAKFSMPGMMDTVLNLGMNDATAETMTRLTGDERFVYDAYRRLIQMFGSVVMNIKDEAFEDLITEKKRERSVKSDTELTATDWKDLAIAFKRVFHEQVGRDFPTDAFEQLKLAIEAVFKSWNGKRAIDYRNAAKIAHDLGTAVNIQAMVFGNMGSDSGTGVAFTREPSTGERKLFGDYLMNAQGEDVVAGIRTPIPIAKLAAENPAIFAQFDGIVQKLERHYREMQDVEFTIERGKLWMLQTRNGKRTARATIRIAVEMADEKLITREEAVLRVSPNDVLQLLHPQFDQAEKDEAKKAGRRLTKGVNASPGAAVGVVAFDADLAEKWGKAGKAVIMVRPETKPDDVHGMLASKGILTSRGGATSHAAVVARQFGVPCVCGADELEIDLRKRTMLAGELLIKEGDTISIDGSAGEVYLGTLRRIDPDFGKETYLQTLLGWADAIRRLDIYANADYPADARRARSYGARGIGLCRTEHMFFQEERLPIVQAMILAEPGSAEEKAELEKLLPFQQDDFYGIFKAMDGLPVVIRLLDPPLHEFLPNHEQLALKAAGLRIVGDRPNELVLTEKLMKGVEALREFNPMLGFRGVRLGITRPAITEMQVRAIFSAACQLLQEGVDVRPEVMIAVTNDVSEVKAMRGLIENVAQEVIARYGVNLHYRIGTMIELPRAAILADEMAGDAEFFSFGTNDLTQTTYGISRDDAEGKFLLNYVERGLFKVNPFQELDEKGVGFLITMAVQKGRAVRPDMQIGICGEHGGDPASIAFCDRSGLNYVSCSPFRVPVARLAAAHATLKNTSRKS
jgi:pyruvate,orthophosphate dikinase